MTYCVAIKVSSGLVFAADTCTNAGVDRVASFRKLFTFGNGTSHALVVMTSGNLATGQALVEQLQRSTADEAGIYSDHSLYDSAGRVGARLAGIVRAACERSTNPAIDFSANVILGGQIQGEAPRLFHIYPQGNFIEASAETPFMQIGEEKYGKPILDRLVKPDMPLERALTCALLSLESTMTSNLSVGMPLDILLYPNDAFSLGQERRIEEGDHDFAALRRYWAQGLQRLADQCDPIKVPG